MHNEAKKIMLERETENDSDFIEKVYFSTRKDEFAMLGWENAQLEMFLKMQFEMQRKSYAAQFPDAENSLIKYSETAVGRLIVKRGADEIRLVDIAILPEFRGRGIGGEIVADLITEAENKKMPLVLSVLRTNTGAFRLYEKLGFVVIAADELYFSMERFGEKNV